MNRIILFNTENFFQHFFTKFPGILRPLRTMLGLDDQWKFGSRDEINAQLNSRRRQIIIEVDAGLIDHDSNIIPIELETKPGTYTLVQVPNYCYRARDHSYRRKTGIDLSEIRTVMISISLDGKYAKKLQGATCIPISIFPTDPTRMLKISEKENPILSILQQLLNNWNVNLYRETVSRADLSHLGKVFISCWVLLLGDEKIMAEIRSQVKKVIHDQYGSVDNLIRTTLETEGAEVLKLFKPEQISGLTPEQISSLTPEQLNSLTPEQVSCLTPELLTSLTSNQLRGLSPEQLRGLSPKQLISILENLSSTVVDELPADTRKKLINILQKSLDK